MRSAVVPDARGATWAPRPGEHPIATSRDAAMAMAAVFGARTSEVPAVPMVAPSTPESGKVPRKQACESETGWLRTHHQIVKLVYY